MVDTVELRLETCHLKKDLSAYLVHRLAEGMKGNRGLLGPNHEISQGLSAVCIEVA
jgi:hypothetical protein